MNDKVLNELLQEKADITARINLITYDGSPEVKQSGEKKYIYIRKRVGSKLTSTYVDVYSDELFALLLKQSKELRELKKKLRHVEKDLALLGCIQDDLDNKVILNLEYARSNMKQIIYDQAILEGVSTTFPQTETIIENGTVNGMKADDIQKILNLKHAWEFVLDKDILSYPSNLDVLSHIAKLVNEGFYDNGGRLRGVPVTIGGSTYKPGLPIEADVKEDIKAIINSKKDIPTKAIELCLYCMKKQIFIDGNKRASVIFANHYLISNGMGLLIVPFELVPEFKKILVEYYEDRDNGNAIKFLLDKCYLRMN